VLQFNSMKKILFLISLVVLSFVYPVKVLAQDSNTKIPKIVTLSADEIINHDYFAAGEKVEIYGTVNGDVYVAGGQITIDGTINGDLLAAGGTININGKISQNVRIVGGQISINADIGKNVSLAGGNIQIDSSTKIPGNLVIGAGTINIMAPVGKEVNLAGGDVTIGNEVKGDTQAAVGDLRLTPKAHLFGNLTYWSQNKASIDESAKVDGNISQTIPPQIQKPNEQSIRSVFRGFKLFAEIFSFISTLVIGLLIVLLFPKFTVDTANLIDNKTFLSLGIGLAALIITPILAIILMITLIGFIPGLLIFIWYFIAIYFSKIFVIFYIGQLANNQLSEESKPILSFIIGIIIFYLITLIPVIGGIISALSVFFGLGILIISKRNVYFEARNKLLI